MAEYSLHEKYARMAGTSPFISFEILICRLNMWAFQVHLSFLYVCNAFLEFQQQAISILPVDLLVYDFILAVPFEIGLNV